MLILGIETSCDETAAALIKASGGLKRTRFKILSNVVSSQAKLHAKYGGVVPSLAKREHQKNLVPVFFEALSKASLIKKLQTPNPKSQTNTKYQILDTLLEREPELLRRFIKYILPMKPPIIDAVAVTVGPGLEPALWTGINFSRALSFLWNKPLLGVNHLEGHIYSNWLQLIAVKSKLQNPNYKTVEIEFPAVCLIVSGGHTELILMKNYGKYQMLGETRDDAAGEAYDKVARLLGLGFPGGPIIDAIASKLPITNYPACAKASAGKQLPIKLPRPMIDSKNYDFSFSGLKTAVLYLVRDLKNANKKVPVEAICAEFQSAVVDVLLAKTLRAAKEYKARTVMVSGGVSANSGLQRAFASHQLPVTSYRVLFPPRELSTDNAAMIAIAGYFNHMLGEKDNWKTLEANAGIRVA